MLTKQAAIRRLTNRWREVADQYPALTVSLATYISANLRTVQRKSLLADYDQA